jgi:hypothetical protein
VSSNGGSTWQSASGTFVKACVPNSGCPNNQSRPTLVVDSAGAMHVFAYGSWAPSNEQNILYSTNASGMFSNWAAVDAESYNQKHASAAIDAANNIHLVWRQRDTVSPTYSVIRSAKYTPGSGFSPSVTIAATPSRYQMSPSIADYNGKQHVVWTESVASDPGIAAWPSEEPTQGAIVYASKSCSTCAWTKTEIVPFANNIWGSIRWSFDTMNGGAIDIVYGANAPPGPYSIRHHSRGSWP